MNWEAFGAIAEALGAAGVIITLAYLAVQIRQNSRLVRASTASTSAAITHDFSSLLVQDPEVARIFWDGMADLSSLSDADRQRFAPLMGIQFTGFNQEHQFVADGVIAPGVFNNRMRTMRRLLQQSGTRQWWDEWRDIFDEGFQVLVDDLIREGEAAE